MDSNEAAKVMLQRGRHKEEFPEDQARRMLDLQQRMGTADYREVNPDESEPEDPQATEPQTDSQNAPNGSTGDTVNPGTKKRGGTQTGG